MVEFTNKQTSRKHTQNTMITNVSLSKSASYALRIVVWRKMFRCFVARAIPSDVEWVDINTQRQIRGHNGTDQNGQTKIDKKIGTTQRWRRRIKHQHKIRWKLFVFGCGIDGVIRRRESITRLSPLWSLYSSASWTTIKNTHEERMA